MKHVQLRAGVTIGIPDIGEAVQIIQVYDSGTSVVIVYAGANIVHKVTITTMSENFIQALLEAKKAEEILNQ